jgi:hypothetical protein
VAIYGKHWRLADVTPTLRCSGAAAGLRRAKAG